MARTVLEGAKMSCDQGSAPACLKVTPGPGGRAVTALPIATVNDHASLVNLPPFGLCRSPANPAVSAATAAAGGALTPQPCVPSVPAPWSGGAALLSLHGVQALTEDARCACAWAGTITVVDPGPGHLEVRA